MADLTTMTLAATLSNHWELASIPLFSQHEKDRVLMNTQRCGAIVGESGMK